MKILKAVACLRRMQGGSQAYMLTASDGCDYVVKFRGNPQGNRILANELLATQLAKGIGLPVPNPVIIEVDSEFIREHRELDFNFGIRTAMPEAGLQFGSRVVSPASNRYPEPQSCANQRTFAGMLAFDKWTSQMDERQAIYSGCGSKWFATFIDFGYAFGAIEWHLFDGPVRGLLSNYAVYEQIGGWDDFEPWLTRIENLSMTAIYQAAENIPAEWYDANREELQLLLDCLFRRRVEVRTLLSRFIAAKHFIFRNWRQHDSPDLSGDAAA